MTVSKNIVSCLLLLVAVEAQRCTPGIVPNIIITSDSQIQWSQALNPSNCVINAYVVDVFDWEDGTQLQHQTSANVLYYNLGNLDMCKTYGFEVHALTNLDVIGPSNRINGTLPPAANLNLTLSVNHATLNNSQVSLTWNPASTVVRCISYYRVIYWDETNSPVDVYVSTNSFTLPKPPVACMEYKFQVSAVVKNPDKEGPLTEISFNGYTAVANPPKIVDIVTTNKTVSMTWQVPYYSENRCNLTALVVSTLGLPASNRTTRITIQDSASRPNVDVFLQSLVPNTVYTSYVSLQNIAGLSKNVTVTYQTSDTFNFSYENDVIYY